MRHCHTQSVGSMQSTAGVCGQMKLQLSVRVPGTSRLHSSTHKAARRQAAELAWMPRSSRHRTAAAAPDTLIAEESIQQPEIDFLGVLHDMQTVRGVLQTAAGPDLVYNTLTDYDSCSRVFGNISGSETLFTDDGDKQVVQACKWQFLAFKGTFNVSLSVMEAPEERLLVFTLAESSFMRDFEGRWQVWPLPDGGSRIEHVLAVKPLLSIPAAVAPYTSSIFKSQVAALLADLQAELDRQMQAAAADAS